MSYGREDEIESDARAMIRVMKASGGSSQREFMSTHPAPENRAQRIKEEIPKRFAQGVPKGLGE
jgi:Zn-dependent protease with chaperone function